MTPKQQVFVQEYLKDMNATQAAIRAGYSPKTASVLGVRALRHPGVAAAIEAKKTARSKRADIDADWVLKRLADEVLADFADLYDDDGGNLKPVREWPLVWRQGLVSGLDVDEMKVGGRKIGEITKVKLSDRIRRLELIGKHVDVQAFAERKEVGGIGGGPLKVEDVTSTEVARRIAFLLAKAAKTTE